VTLSGRVPVSFEVYPPRTRDLLAPLQESVRLLDELAPDFISVTYGAGGSSTRDSLDVLRFIRDNARATPLAHLTCVGTGRDEAAGLIDDFVGHGITHFLALRGDLPEGSTTHTGELPYASDLVDLMATRRSTTGGPETIAVAAFPNGHPDSTHPHQDIQALRAKQEAGADFAITQLFFYAKDYLRFVNQATAAGVTMPLLPGIMPITSPSRLNRVIDLTGESMPADLAGEFGRTDDPLAWEQIGVRWAADMVRELVDGGAPGIHLYAFNQHRHVMSVLEEAGVR
jgi:methylenetetrahydrofolate reductase (NADPH)